MIKGAKGFTDEADLKKKLLSRWGEEYGIKDLAYVNVCYKVDRYKY